MTERRMTWKGYKFVQTAGRTLWTAPKRHVLTKSQCGKAEQIMGKGRRKKDPNPFKMDNGAPPQNPYSLPTHLDLQKAYLSTTRITSENGSFDVRVKPCVTTGVKSVPSQTSTTKDSTTTHAMND